MASPTMLVTPWNCSIGSMDRGMLFVKSLLLGLCLLLVGVPAFSAPYSTSGAGSSTIGTSGDYTSLAAACAAVSGTTNNFTVTNKAISSGVATLTLGAPATFVVGQSITVALSPADNRFDGTFTVTASSGNTVSYSRQGTVTNKVLTSNVATLTLSLNQFVVGQSVVVALSPADAVFDGTYTITVNGGSTISYARTNANVTSVAYSGTVRIPDVTAAAVGGVVYTTAGTGTRDASNWTFLIQNNLTEQVNSELRCTVNAAGSITFKPDAGVQPTITWPNTITANSQSSGHISIGAAGGGTSTLTPTNNIIFDGSNSGGKTRDLTLQSQANSAESGLFLRIRGNCDGIQFKNLNIIHNSTLASCQAITFTSDVNASGNDKYSDNWTVDNCLVYAQGSTTGEPIRATNSGTLATGSLAQSGYTISNNLILGGNRGVFLNQNQGGNVSGNTVRLSAPNGLLGWAIYHSAANGASGYTLNICNNVIDQIATAGASAGDYGYNGILLSPSATACTMNVYNNTIGGWAFTGAAVDQSYQAISVRGAATGSASAIINIEHNSINMNSTASVTGATINRAHAITRTATATPPTLSIKNNIIRFLQGGTNAYAIYAAAAGNITYSGNDIVTGASSAGFVSIAGAATATTYAAYQGLDANAQNIDPTSTAGGKWANASANQIVDLHFTGTPTTLLVCGVPSTFLTDIDGETRPSGGAAIPGADVVSASTSYTWVASSGDVSVAGNWSPNRVSPKWNDTLVFDGQAVASPTVRITDQHVGGLQLINNIAVSFTCLPVQNRLTIYNGDNGSGADLSVEAGSSLKLTGSSQVTLDLCGGATGNVGGDVVFASSAAGIAHRILVRTTGALVFANGSTCAMAPASTGGGTGFGTTALTDSALNAVVFQSGSTFHQSALKNGTRSAGTGSSPFGGSLVSPFVVFNSGSTFVNWGSTAAALVDITGRTFGNYVWRSPFSGSDAAANLWTVQNTLTLGATSAGTAGTLTFGSTFGAGTAASIGNIVAESGATVGGLADSGVPAAAGSNFIITGNVDISNNPTKFALNASANRVYVLGGTSSQTVNFGGVTIPNLTVNNAAGAVLANDCTVGSALTLTSGNLDTNGKNLTLGTSAASVGTLSAPAGRIIGALKRWVSTAATFYQFPLTSASGELYATVSFSTGPTNGGTLTTKFTATDPGENGLPLTADTLTLSNVAPDGYYTITAGDGLSNDGIYAVRLGNGWFNNRGDAETLRIVKRATSSDPWTLAGQAAYVAADNNATSVVARGFSGFSEFGIAGVAGQLPVTLSGLSIE